MRPNLAMAIAAALIVAQAASADDAVLDDFVARASDADIVVIGEIHDNPEHHEIQAGVVRRLQPDALVFEMIPAARSDLVNDLRREGADREAIAEALDWDQSGWPSFDFYAPILEAAPEARIHGAGQSRPSNRKAAQEGAASAFGPEAESYGLARDLDTGESQARRAEMASAHCNALPEAALDGMIEVQRFWDATLARAALEALGSAGEEAQVVMIAGNGHADRTRGAPSVLSLVAPDIDVIVLGLVESPPGEGRAFDMTITSPPPDREDPCAAFEASEEG